MKRILLLAVITFSFLISRGQSTLPFPLPQSIGNDSTLLNVHNTIANTYIFKPFTDTVAANASHAGYYNGALISTANGQFLWERYNGAWVPIAIGTITIPTLQQVTTAGAYTTNTFGVKNGTKTLVGIGAGGSIGEISLADTTTGFYNALFPSYEDYQQGSNFLHIASPTTITGSFTQTFQNKTGTVADLSDIIFGGGLWKDSLGYTTTVLDSGVVINSNGFQDPVSFYSNIGGSNNRIFRELQNGSFFHYGYNNSGQEIYREAMDVTGGNYYISVPNASQNSDIDAFNISGGFDGDTSTVSIQPEAKLQINSATSPINAYKALVIDNTTNIVGSVPYTNGTVTSLRDSSANGVFVRWVNRTTTPAPIDSLGNITPTTVTTNSIFLLPQSSATLPPTTGNVLFDSSGVNYRDKNGTTLRINKSHITQGATTTLFPENKTSYTIADSADVATALGANLQTVTNNGDSTTNNIKVNQSRIYWKSASDSTYSSMIDTTTFRHGPLWTGSTKSFNYILPKSTDFNLVFSSLISSQRGAFNLINCGGINMNADSASFGPDFGNGNGGLKFRKQTESQSENFWHMRGGGFVVEDSNAIWQMSVIPNHGVNFGSIAGLPGVYPLSEVEVSGSLSVGSSNALTNAAPTNGLLVQGKTALNMTSTAPIDGVDVGSNMTIGALYAGANAAPTNGLLIQGGLAIATGTTTVSDLATISSPSGGGKGLTLEGTAPLFTMDSSTSIKFFGGIPNSAGQYVHGSQPGDPVLVSKTVFSTAPQNFYIANGSGGALIFSTTYTASTALDSGRFYIPKDGRMQMGLVLDTPTVTKYPESILTFTPTTLGVLLPRSTTGQINTLAGITHHSGLLIVDTTLSSDLRIIGNNQYPFVIPTYDSAQKSRVNGEIGIYNATNGYYTQGLVTGDVNTVITAGAGTLSVGTYNSNYAAKTGNYTLVNTDGTINITTSSITITLPTAVGISGKIFYIKNTSGGTATLNTTSSQTIYTTSAVTSITLNNGDAYEIQSNGANYIVL